MHVVLTEGPRKGEFLNFYTSHLPPTSDTEGAMWPHTEEARASCMPPNMQCGRGGRMPSSKSQPAPEKRMLHRVCLEYIANKAHVNQAKVHY